MIDKLKPLIGKLCSFSQKRLGFARPPKLFLRNDSKNSQNTLGKTAFYDPNKQSITLFVHGRHPKDILRSFSHELVHHAQNLRGDLSPDKISNSGANYAQKCPHMRNMEKEAYLKGNMCFRDWEDQYKLTESESKFLKENKSMTTKITKEFLKEMIEKALEEGVASSVAKAATKLAKPAPLPKKKREPVKSGDRDKVEVEPVNTESEEIEGDVVEEENEELEETSVQTPEQEEALYEQRFAPKNKRLFEKLVKQWTK